jgi:tetratricopeptide (TPR) repeat protein
VDKFCDTLDRRAHAGKRHCRPPLCRGLRRLATLGMRDRARRRAGRTPSLPCGKKLAGDCPKSRSDGACVNKSRPKCGSQNGAPRGHRACAGNRGPPARRVHIIAARDYLARARSIYQALPDTSGDNALRIAWTTSDRALIEADAGNVETALGLITELLDAPRISSWWRVISNVLIAATYCLTLLGRYDEAERYALEALAVHRRHRLQPATGWLLQQYAMTISYRPHASAERMHSSHVRAAKILGFVNASLPELGTSRTPAGVLEYGQILNVLRSSLDPGTLAKQMFLGAAMDEDAAAELMLQTAT